MVHYRPILKAKPGELQALGNLAPTVASQLTPFLEICPADTHQEAIAKALTPATKYLSAYGVVGLDAGALPASIGTTDVATHIGAELSTHGVGVIPVVRLGDDLARLTSSAAVAAGHGQGAAIRVQVDSAVSGHGLSASSVSTVLAALGLSFADVDLLLDFGPISGVAPGFLSSVAALASFALTLGPWRSITVASGAFPSSISNLPKGVRHTLARVDAELWRDLQGQGVTVDFGDYAINHPELGQGGRGPLPNLRYTDGRTWAVWREEKKRPGNESFYDLCKKVVNDAAWPGSSFSWGDAEIEMKALELTPGAGTATQWRAYGTSHHLTTVVDRLATHGEP